MKISKASLAPLLVASLALSCSQQQGGGEVGHGGEVAASGAPASAAQGGAAKLAVESVPKEKFADGRRSFETVRDTLLKSYYADGLGEDDVYRAATQGMLTELDPKLRKWNKLMSPGELAEMRASLKGEVVGVGVRIGKFDKDTGYSDVDGTLPGSPAEKAGIVAGDKILEVNGKLYKGMSLEDVVADVRGKAGETVTLSVLHEGKVVSVPIQRQLVRFDDVTELLLPGAVGYLRIPSFTSNTAATLKTALSDLSAKGAHALVVDLRDCPGGDFEAAIASVELFVPSGGTIARLARRGQTEEVFASKNASPTLPDAPMAVLVDHDTSSGGELATAALQEDRHAQIVGQPTFGKWTVQKLEDLPNGFAFKYTSGLFRSPSGRSYEGVGLVPDVRVDMSADDLGKVATVTDPDKRLTQDVQLRTAVTLLRGK